MFEKIERVPGDAILGLIEAFKKDTNPQKVDLGVGVYKDAQGNTPVMRAVKEAEALLLKNETTSGLCFSCHENNKTNRAFVHGPVAAGDCNICHNPHSAPYDNLAEEKGADLCLLCHIDRKEEFTRKRHTHGKHVMCPYDE